MTLLAVIQRTNSIQGDKVFRGVYGTATRSEVEYTPAGTETPEPVINFQLAPEFNAISSVFSFISAQMTSMKEDELRMIEVPDAQMTQVKDQLMLNLKTRWANLYESQMGGSQLVTAALKGEAANVTAAVDRHFAARNIKVWTVPVLAKLKARIDGAYYATKEELLEGLTNSQAESFIEVDLNGMPTIDTASTTQAPTEPGGELQNTNDSVTPEWNDYAGIQAEVKGFVHVAAASALAAVAHLNYLLADQGSPTQMLAPRVTPTEIISVSQLTYGDAVTDAADNPLQDEEDLDDDRPDAERG